MIETVICVAPDRWDDNWTSRQQIMGRLARWARVLFLQPNGSNGRDVPAGVPVELIDLGRPVPYFARYLPTGALHRWFRLRAAARARTIARKLRRVLSDEEMRRCVLWLWHPDDYLLPGLVQCAASCYRVYDDVASFPSNRRIGQPLRAADRHLCQSVDAVFASSRSQYEARAFLNPDTYFIPNGVDTLHYGGDGGGLQEPEDLRGIPRPRLGFFGQIDWRIDWPIARSLLQQGAWSVVFAGPVVGDTIDAVCREAPNFHYLGRKDPSVLPAYVRAVDCGIIPYVLDDCTRQMFVLKAGEFLAAGKPVVATPLPELRYYGAIVATARAEEFATTVSHELSRDGPSLARARRQVAEANSWERRTAEMWSKLVAVAEHESGDDHEHRCLCANR